MQKYHYLVLDDEKKKLLEKFNDIHIDGGDLVFNLLLKFYIKFAVWHKRKGRNPINAFQDLVEREIKGIDSSDISRLRFLNELIDKGEEIVDLVDETKMEGKEEADDTKVDVSEASDDKSYEKFSDELKQELQKEVGGLKDLILTMKSSGAFARPAQGKSLNDFAPQGAAVLTKVGDAKPKKRLNYRDLRTKGGGAKKISFD